MVCGDVRVIVVDAVHVVDRPFAFGQLPDQVAFDVVQVQVLPTRALGQPQQLGTVGGQEESELPAEVDIVMDRLSLSSLNTGRVAPVVASASSTSARR